MKKCRIFIVLLWGYLGIVSHLSAQTITTVVGTGAAGYTGDGGLAINSEIALTKGVDFDNQGNLLVCNANAVRKVNLINGIITTIAGSDTASSAGGGGNGGPATSSLLVEPYDVCVDKLNNCYIVDYWTYRVRKVNVLTGIIDVYAGSTNGNSGDGGPAINAKFAGVVAICIDTSRNYLYVSDGWNYRVRRIDMVTGIIDAFAGNGINGYDGDGGLATAAKFGRVFGIALDKAGNVYIGDWDNRRIRKVAIETGIVTTIAGNGMNGFGGDGGPATAAMLRKPTAICFDKCDNLYFSDEENNRVRRIDAITGIISTVAGVGTAGFSGDGGAALLAEFNHPTGVGIDKDFNLYVGDYYNNRVRKINLGNCEATGLGIKNNSEAVQKITLYPNPVQDELNVRSEEAIQEVALYNAVGQLVLHGAGGGQRSAKLAVGQLPAGVYMVRVNGHYVNRIVKQ